jgi:hypothetical protein
MSLWAYASLGGWIIVLGLYLSNAFERIAQLEKRIEKLEGKEGEDWSFTFSYQSESEIPLPEGIRVFRPSHQQPHPFHQGSENDNARSIVFAPSDSA